MSERPARLTNKTSWIMAAACSAMALVAQTASAQEIRITKTDAHIDALDPGVRLFVREKMPEGNTQLTSKDSRATSAILESFCFVSTIAPPTKGMLALIIAN